jgi:hypothetical protein
MQTIIRYSVLLSLALLSLQSCQTNCDCEHLKKLPAEAITNSGQRQGDVDASNGQASLKAALAQNLRDKIQKIPNIDQFPVEKATLAALKLDQLNIEQNTKASVADDAALVNSILSAILSAENKLGALDIQVFMSNEPIEDGVFVFSIQSQDNKQLQFQLYDEEGFDMLASNELKLNKGNNYKSLNVKNLDKGSYILKFKDQTNGKELMRRLNIAK